MQLIDDDHAFQLTTRPAATAAHHQYTRIEEVQLIMLAGSSVGQPLDRNSIA